MKSNRDELNVTENPIDDARRSLMKHSLKIALFSIPLVTMLNSQKVLADEEGDVTKIKFHYQDHPNGPMKCSQCVYFVKPVGTGLTGVCRIIDGDVTSNSWCTAFRTP